MDPARDWLALHRQQLEARCGATELVLPDLDESARPAARMRPTGADRAVLQLNIPRAAHGDAAMVDMRGEEGDAAGAGDVQQAARLPMHRAPRAAPAAAGPAGTLAANSAARARQGGGGNRSAGSREAPPAQRQALHSGAKQRKAGAGPVKPRKQRAPRELGAGVSRDGGQAARQQAQRALQRPRQVLQQQKQTAARRNVRNIAARATTKPRRAHPAQRTIRPRAGAVENAGDQRGAQARLLAPARAKQPTARSEAAEAAAVERRLWGLPRATPGAQPRRARRSRGPAFTGMVNSIACLKRGVLAYTLQDICKDEDVKLFRILQAAQHRGGGAAPTRTFLMSTRFGVRAASSA